jgi:hypothetical protein
MSLFCGVYITFNFVQCFTLFIIKLGTHPTVMKDGQWDKFTVLYIC